PELHSVSKVTGQPPPQGTGLDAAYWRRHCREPVRFWPGLTALLEWDTRLFVEIGPAPVLSHLGKRLEPAAVWLPSLRRRDHDWHVLSASLAEAYAHGADVDWCGFDAPFPLSRMCLPTYPFQRKRYWIVERETPMTDEQPTATELPKNSCAAQREAIVAHLRRLTAALLRADPAEIDVSAPFLEMGADSLLLVEAVRVIEDHFGVKLAIRQFFEEITTLNVLTDYLMDRTAFGLSHAAAVEPAPEALRTPSVPMSGPTSPVP